MADSFSAKGFGVELSFEAIEYIENTFPQIVAKKGFGFTAGMLKGSLAEGRKKS